MSEKSKIVEAADRIWNSIHTKATCEPIRDLLGETDVEAAYEAQQINTMRKLSAGEIIVGCKIGLTSFAVQKQLGVDEPDFGMLTNVMMVNENTPIPWSELTQPKAEAEIAFILSKDIDKQLNSIDELIESIAFASPAIEVVGSRIEGWNIRITDTIADNASASHFVLGKSKVLLSQMDLEGCQMNMKRAGEIVSTGSGRASMGNPLNAALWLANTMIDKKAALKKGDIILTGALGPIVAVNPGDEFHAEIDGLGTVSVSFGK